MVMVRMRPSSELPLLVNPKYAVTVIPSKVPVRTVRGVTTSSASEPVPSGVAPR